MVKQTIEKPAERNDSKYTGVRKRKWGKWVSEIRLPNSRERIWLGSYDTAEKAARAFDAASYCLRGHTARFNFPDNPPDIVGGRSMTPSEIQVAATRFANSETYKIQSERFITSELLRDSSSPSLSEGTTILPMESPSPSLFEGTVQTDSDLTLEGSYSDLFTAIGSGNYAFDYGIFQGFDDFSDDFYIPELPTLDCGEENMDGLIIQDSFLWNF